MKKVIEFVDEFKEVSVELKLHGHEIRTYERKRIKFLYARGCIDNSDL